MRVISNIWADAVFLSSGMLNSESPEHKRPDSYDYIYDQVRIEERLRE